MDLFNILEIFIPFMSIALMFGMGLAMSITDLKMIKKVPKKIVVGVSSQVLLLPCVAFMVCSIFQLPPQLAIGLMIIAACPGGPISNLTSHLVNANVALSVCLTSITTIICMLTAPLIISFSIVYFLGEQYDSISITQMSLVILLLTIIPVLLGAFLKMSKPNIANKLVKPVKIVSIVFIVIIMFMCIYQNQQAQISSWNTIISASITLNLTTVLLGVLIALNAGLNLRDSATISFETGMQNFSLAMIIATNTLGEPAYTIAMIVYGLTMTGCAIICMYIFKKFQFKEPESPNLPMPSRA